MDSTLEGGTLAVELGCKGVEIAPGVYVGAASLLDLYLMLRAYAAERPLDEIYEHNVRTWLGRRSVNAGIARTLREEPERFVAFNNGVTLVCRAYRETERGLAIEQPQIVNGCQTTRTLHDVLARRLEGKGGVRHTVRYREAFLPFKLIAVPDLESGLVKDITRYSNRQNAVRGRDFLALEDTFRRLRSELAERGYDLEVQAGRAERSIGPRIPAFDALRDYAAAVLSKPHLALGQPAAFTRDGGAFDEAVEQLIADDLLVPWLVGRDAEALGYTQGPKPRAPADDHRPQARYFFLYVFFRCAASVLQDADAVERGSRRDLYADLLRLRQAESQPYRDLLETADGIVATFQVLSRRPGMQRAALLKGEELLDEQRFIMASTMLLLRKAQIRDAARQVLAA